MAQQQAVTLEQLPISAIRPNPRQPRQVFDEDDLAELAASIGDVGLLQAVVVRPAPDSGSEPGHRDEAVAGYELVMGERRWRASQLAGLDTIPALVRHTSDDQLLREAMLENLHRVALNPLEEAAAYQQMIHEFDATQEDVAAAVHKSRSHVSHMISLLRLPNSIQRRVAAGVLSAGHAKALLRVPEPSAALRLAERIVAEGLSVRSTEEIIALGDLPGWEDDAGPVMRPPRPRPVPEDAVLEAATRLGDRLDTRVRISAGRTKGRIIVEFAGREDLDRILAVLDSTPPRS